jgi:hypothetical protein
METRNIAPELDNCHHFYGKFSRLVGKSETQYWVEISERLKVFLEDRDVEQGWKIYEVCLGQTSVSFVVESASRSNYIEERLFYYTLVYLRKDFPKLSAIEDELFWNSVTSSPPNSSKHLERKLNLISQWKNSNVQYEVEEPSQTYGRDIYL